MLPVADGPQQDSLGSSPSPLSNQHVFTREQRLHLISLIHQIIETNNEPSAESGQELSHPVKLSFENHTQLWEDLAASLSNHFGKSFLPENVKWNWLVLVFKYRSVKSNCVPGGGPAKFNLYTQMSGFFSSLSTAPLPENMADPSQQSHEARTTGDCQEVEMPSSTMKINEGFTHQQTLYMIDLMREIVEGDGRGPSKCLPVLNRRLRLARKRLKKPVMFYVADMMNNHFKETFPLVRLRRKWLTLVDAYKTVKKRGLSLGQMRFKYYKEMEELLKGRDFVEATASSPLVDVEMDPVELDAPGEMEDEDLTSDSMPLGAAFTKYQTLFLIDWICQHVESDGLGPPKSLADLKHRLGVAIVCNKSLWQNLATALGSEFQSTFSGGTVENRWKTLVKEFKRDKQEMMQTGRRTRVSQFYKEMNNLCGGRLLEADQLSATASQVQLTVCPAPKVQATSLGTLTPVQPPMFLPLMVQLCGPEGLAANPTAGTSSGTPLPIILPAGSLSTAPTTGATQPHVASAAMNTSGVPQISNGSLPASLNSAHSQSTLAVVPPQTESTSRMKSPRQWEREMLVFLKESEAASQRRHVEALAQLKSAQEGLESCLAKFLAKM